MQSDLLTPRQLAPLMGKSYSSMMAWLAKNADRVEPCAFLKGTRKEYSRRLLIEHGILREESHV